MGRRTLHLPQLNIKLHKPNKMLLLILQTAAEADTRSVYVIDIVIQQLTRFQLTWASRGLSATAELLVPIVSINSDSRCQNIIDIML